VTSIDPIYVGADAVQQLAQYCDEKGLNRFALIADDNTYQALGERAERALKERGAEVTKIVLMGEEVIADEHYLVDALVRAPRGGCTFLAVGSGTLTDITRFVSHRMGQAFISLPTAPSVDGFASIGAPLVLSGVKTTILCQAPLALFADLETLCHAPRRLIAAGFGDMVGKYTSGADWTLGSLLWGEPFDTAIAKRSAAALQNCISRADEIREGGPEGVRDLMAALIESGLCMLDFGATRPASGAEHHAAHYLEMKLLLENRPAIPHGAKVGMATVHVAAQYARIRGMSRQEMQDRLEAATLPDRDEEIATIEQGFGRLAEGVIKEHLAFLNLTEAGFDALKQRIADQWEAIQSIAGKVPPPATIAEYLRRAGAATAPAELGLSQEEVELAYRYGHYLRNRFTVVKLSRVLGLPLV
jgi:glycerol-1-phosphate dehydrogenase [NAD(P)+]